MPAHPRVALFVTCLVDLFRPNIGFAAVRLLEKAGCAVHVPEGQTCCGQPAYNNGDYRDARDIARRVIEVFEGYDYVVAPSGSCASVLKVHYPTLFEAEPEWRDRAQQFSERCYELVSFLTDVLGIDRVGASYCGEVTYHDSCSSLRELGIRQQPRRMLRSVNGLSLTEMEETEVCCGFGGAFCVKYPEISTRMVSDKVDRVSQTGADTLLAGDLGCLLNIAGRLGRLGSQVKVFHVAEVLADMANVPSIGEGS